MNNDDKMIDAILSICAGYGGIDTDAAKEIIALACACTLKSSR